MVRPSVASRSQYTDTRTNLYGILFCQEARFQRKQIIKHLVFVCSYVCVLADACAGDGDLSFHPGLLSLLILGIYLREWKTLIRQKNECTLLSIISLFLITKTWKYQKYSLPTSELYGLYAKGNAFQSQREKMKSCHLQQQGWTWGYSAK